jgi:hypothetical protein
MAGPPAGDERSYVRRFRGRSEPMRTLPKVVKRRRGSLSSQVITRGEVTASGSSIPKRGELGFTTSTSPPGGAAGVAPANT